MGVVKKGFEGQLFVGTAGATASNLLLNCQDIKTEAENTTDETTVRGDGSVAPLETVTVVKRTRSFEWTMVNNTNDTQLAFLLEAADEAEPVALRSKAYSTGLGYDGDVYITAFPSEWNLDAVQKYTFTAKPTDDAGRTPLTRV